MIHSLDGLWLIHHASLQEIIEKGEKQPNLTIGILASVVVVFVTIFFRLVFGGKKPVSSEIFFMLININFMEVFFIHIHAHNQVSSSAG